MKADFSREISNVDIFLRLVQSAAIIKGWGAEMRPGLGAQSHNNNTDNKHDISLLSTCSSVVTRSMSKRREGNTTTLG